MTGLAWVIVVVVIAVLVAATWLFLRQRSRAQLQQRFGPEYERVVERSGSRRRAEQELAEVARRRDQLEIRELEPVARQQYRDEWSSIQARFVDEPAGAVGSAATLISSVMRERGYPIEDFDQRASLVSADHPDVVEHYREAQAAYDRHRQAGEGDTEDLRQSFVHYRALFTALVDNERGSRPRPAGPTDQMPQSQTTEADR